MFYEGSLQSGIALALSESKCVACFVRDGGEESSRWENEYLQDANVKTALNSKTVLLRINTASEEAGFLSAYYPIRSTPSLILISNGQLTLELHAGIDQNAFKLQLLTTLVAQPGRRPEPPNTSGSTPAPGPVRSESLDETNDAEPAQSTQPGETIPKNEGSPEPASENANNEAGVGSSIDTSVRQPSAIESLLQDRRRRLELDKKAKEEAEKADRKAKAEARREALLKDPKSAKAKQATYAQEQRKRQHEAKLERDRVLRQIEQDKLERKEREERRKALAKAEQQDSLGEDTATADVDGNKVQHNRSTSSNIASVGGSEPKECAIQVRLFDGSTIRSKFPVGQSLKEVREWVDSQRPDDVPFTFKQILSPLPNRSLTISDEQDTLRELDFIPSATLVMIPIEGYTAAYDGAGPGILSRGISAGYNTVAAGAGIVSGALGTFLGVGQARPAEPVAEEKADEKPQDPQPSSSGSGIKVRTLRDQRDNRDDHQLYNGNQLNFEPRRDDDKKDD